MPTLRTSTTRCFEMARQASNCTIPKIFRRQYSGHAADKQIKVAVLGASGAVGQPLSLLLKHSPLISKLTLYDSVHTPAVAEDLSHIETKCQVEGYLGEDQLTKALAGADLVILPAGIRKRAGVSSEEHFNTNASIVHRLATACARTCPQAILGITSYPVNSTVAIASEVYKKEKVYDPNKIFGVTTLDVVRGNTFLSQLVGVDPAKLNLPVVGGHSGVTSVPLFSQSGIRTSLSKYQLQELTERVQDSSNDVIHSKAGAASLAMARAYAAARFTFSMLRALMGAQDVVECAYVKSDVTDSPYFATPVLLGPQGMKENLGLGTTTAFEQDLIAKAIPEIKKDIKMGEAFDPSKIRG